MINIERVQKLLKERSLTYTELGELAGISQQAAHRYCTGITKTVPADRLASIARALGTTPDYLLGNDTSITSEERQVFAAYNNLIPENKKMIDSLIDKLLRSQAEH